MKRHCIVIAQGYPRTDNGFGLAMISSLKQYERAFDQVTYVCITHEAADGQFMRPFPGVQFVHVPIVLKSPKRRFAASLLTSLPASVMQMNSAAVWKRLSVLVGNAIEQADALWCVVENFSPTIFIDKLKRRFPTATIVHRAHDVPSLAFAPFARSGSPLSRLAWRWEIARIRAVEARSANRADRVWAITSEDARSIQQLYGRKCDGVLGVRLDLTRYLDVEPGAYHRVLYVGSSDIRKAQGLLRFIGECWPRVKEHMPEMELWIAGAGTERFGGLGPGVHAVGAVADEREFLALGRTVINPQEAGTGIKLKSLVALAAGKLLVSTLNGVMGIEGGQSRRHYLESATSAELADNLLLLRSDRDRVEEIARAGRALMVENYDLGGVARDDHLFEQDQ